MILQVFVQKTNLANLKTEVDQLDSKSFYQFLLSEIETTIPSISGLTTTSALTAVENKIPNFSNFVKGTNYYTKISELEKTLTDHKHDKLLLLSLIS